MWRKYLPEVWANTTIEAQKQYAETKDEGLLNCPQCGISKANLRSQGGYCGTTDPEGEAYIQSRSCPYNKYFAPQHWIDEPQVISHITPNKIVLEPTLTAEMDMPPINQLKAGITRKLIPTLLFNRINDLLPQGVVGNQTPDGRNYELTYYAMDTDAVNELVDVEDNEYDIMFGAEEFEAQRIQYDYMVHREPSGTEVGADGKRITNPRGGRFTSADAESFNAETKYPTTFLRYGWKVTMNSKNESLPRYAERNRNGELDTVAMEKIKGGKWRLMGISVPFVRVFKNYTDTFNWLNSEESPFLAESFEAESKKKSNKTAEKAILTGASTGATMEIADALLAAEDDDEQYRKLLKEIMLSTQSKGEFEWATHEIKKLNENKAESFKAPRGWGGRMSQKRRWNDNHVVWASDSKLVRQALKEQFPDYKFGVSIIDGQYIQVVVKSGNRPANLDLFREEVETAAMKPIEEAYEDLPEELSDKSVYVMAYDSDFNAESFNVEFDDWADQEMKTHGDNISFKKWAKEEGEKHGDVPLTDWAEHEEESHDERYGAEDVCSNCKQSHDVETTTVYIDDETGEYTLDPTKDSNGFGDTILKEHFGKCHTMDSCCDLCLCLNGFDVYSTVASDETGVFRKVYEKPLIHLTPQEYENDWVRGEYSLNADDNNFEAENCEHFWDVARDGENYNRCLNCGGTNQGEELLAETFESQSAQTKMKPPIKSIGILLGLGAIAAVVAPENLKKMFKR